MKRFLSLCTVSILILLFVQASYGAPAYGTHMPEERHWTCGLEVNSLIDRNLDNDEGGTNGNRYFLTCSYGVFSWFSFDGKIGIGDVNWDRSRGAGLNYSTNFAGAYGFRIKGPEKEEWGIKSVAGFQHISVHPEARNQGGNKNESIIDDWQFSTVVSKDVGDFVPYLGAKYGTLDFIKRTNEVDRKRIKAEKNYGLIVGLDYWLNGRTKLNLEGAFLDGEEIALGISYDF
ncbi:hypothetical protein ACFL0P_00960 [Candidatus Omnitrophota bacterium]